MERNFRTLAGFETLFTPIATRVQLTVQTAAKPPRHARPESLKFFGTILIKDETLLLGELDTKSSYTFGNPQNIGGYEWTTPSASGASVWRETRFMSRRFRSSSDNPY